MNCIALNKNVNVYVSFVYGYMSHPKCVKMKKGYVYSP